jgi:L-alanine-DL-glutamate epimerase-like enolase superfamily enzyme
MTTPILDKLALHRLRIPLKTPYKVAFALIEHFDTIVAELVDRDGNVGLGEATILTGYTDETIEGSWAAARAFADSLTTLSREEALTQIDRFGVKFPFAATAFGTAFEMANGSAWLQPHAETSVPLLGLLNAKSEDSIEAELQGLIDAGYRTVKVKVGFEATKDARLVKSVQRATKGRVRIRLDANQGYTTEQAMQFVKALDPADIELFEQPCQAGDWDAHLSVRRVSPVPMMLDESIYTVADIERAARLNAASYIKVKLMKLVTLDALSAALERIKALGMQPVLGNGVACDLGCWMESCIAARHIDNAGEMNGFLKASAPLLAETLQLRQGAVRVQPGFSPRLDRASLTEHLIDSVVCRPGVAPEQHTQAA